jgi:VWFA-related protein
VLKDGKPVEDLKALDFEVRDRGLRQAVEIVGDPRGADKRLDVVLALDVSDSVKGEPLQRLKAAAHAFVDLLRPEDAFSLLTFASRLELVVTPGDSRARAHEVIEATPAQLATSLHDAAFAAVATVDAARGRPLALVLSDGKDHGSWLPPERVLRAAQASELVVHVVSIGEAGPTPKFLLDLAAATGGAAWRADFTGLRDVLEQALGEFRSRYTLRYERSGPSRPGWHPLEVKVRRPGVKVRARTGYREGGEAVKGRP